MVFSSSRTARIEIDISDLPDLLTCLWEVVCTPEYMHHRPHFDAVVSQVARICGLTEKEIFDTLPPPEQAPPVFPIGI